MILHYSFDYSAMHTFISDLAKLQLKLGKDKQSYPKKKIFMELSIRT